MKHKNSFRFKICTKKLITKLKLRLIFFTIILSSCSNFREATCEEAADSVRSDSCNIVVSEHSTNEYKFYLEGINPQTKNKAYFKKINYTWAYWFIDKIEKGDTIIKKTGELKFYIHKKQKILVFPFECNGAYYE